LILFFFFQAEDGIRDRNVTGVQTCALPIFDPDAGTDRVISHSNPTAHFAGVRRGTPLSQSNTGARHRAARRPITPLHTIGNVVTGPAGRRTAVAAASSGLVLTLTASASLAAVQPPVRAGQRALPPPAARAGPGASQGETEPVGSVDADAEWTFGSDEVSAEAPAPLPEPEPEPGPEPAPRATTAASRSGDR